jgi:hypothetical protein
VIVCVALVLVVGFIALFSRSKDSASASAVNVGAAASTNGASVTPTRGDRTPGATQVAGATETDSGSTQNSLRSAEEVLQTAIESSLSGVLDVQALLDSTMSLTNLPMQPPPSGGDENTTREFRLLNPPPSVDHAEVWISPASGPDGIRALSLRVKLQRTVQPYVVAGSPRFGPEIDVTVIADGSGAFLEHRILTRLEAAGRGSGKEGPNVTASDVVEGVACQFDPTGTRKDSLTFFGTKNGRSAKWSGPIALSGADPTDKWNELRKILWTRFQESQKR